jgi:hypothetical protein
MWHAHAANTKISQPRLKTYNGVSHLWSLSSSILRSNSQANRRGEILDPLHTAKAGEHLEHGEHRASSGTHFTRVDETVRAPRLS